MKPTVIFFGSFLEHSAKILEILHQSNQLEIQAVVTTPPKPAGRDQKLQKTHVHEYAETHQLSVFTPEKLDNTSLNEFKHQLLNLKNSVDLFVVAGYGKLLPPEWLEFPCIAPINIHFSLLPKYRGAMPGEWAILMGETITGNSLIEMSTKFDTGSVFAQQELNIDPEETRETLYSKLYPAGAHLLLSALPKYLTWKQQLINIEPKTDLPAGRQGTNNQQLITSDKRPPTNSQQPIFTFLPPLPQPPKSPFFARLVKKDETFIPWDLILSAMNKMVYANKLPKIFNEVLTNTSAEQKSLLHTTNYCLLIERSIRAFSGWPGVWTIVPTAKGDKRLKLHSAHIHNQKLILDDVQLEGAQTTDFDQIKSQIV